MDAFLFTLSLSGLLVCLPSTLSRTGLYFIDWKQRISLLDFTQQLLFRSLNNNVLR